MTVKTPYTIDMYHYKTLIYEIKNINYCYCYYYYYYYHYYYYYCYCYYYFRL